jgi:hypothetical protein
MVPDIEIYYTCINLSLVTVWLEIMYIAKQLNLVNRKLQCKIESNY